MVRQYLNPLRFLSLLMVLYFLTRFLRLQIGDLSPFIAFYFTDLLFIPVQLTICLIILRFLKRDNTLEIPVYLIFITVVIMSFLFEWYLPFHKKSSHQVSDKIDILMYFLGGVIFFYAQKKWLK